MAKSNVFFFNGIFPILSYLSNLPCCDPEPQTTAKLPPHNVVAQHFGWFCHFCSWARPVCRSRKAGQKGGNCCGMCKVPNTPNLGAKPSALHWALQGPMMPCHALVAKWVGGLHVWGLSLPRVGRLGVANVGLLQAWSAKVLKMAHCRPKTANRGLEVPDWPIVFQKQTQKNAVWQATATVASAAEKRANLGQPGPKPVGPISVASRRSPV